MMKQEKHSAKSVILYASYMFVDGFIFWLINCISLENVCRMQDFR